MADSRRFEKARNRHISTMVQPIATKFGMMLHTDSLNPPTIKIYNLISKNSRWRMASF